MRKRLLALVAGFILLFPTVAQACLQQGLEWEVSHKRQVKIAHLAHEVWRNDDTAHFWERRISCESKGRKYARNTEYLGLTQMGYDERHACNWTWDMLVQLQAARCWAKRGGTWSC